MTDPVTGGPATEAAEILLDSFTAESETAQVEFGFFTTMSTLRRQVRAIEDEAAASALRASRAAAEGDAGARGTAVITEGRATIVAHAEGLAFHPRTRPSVVRQQLREIDAALAAAPLAHTGEGDAGALLHDIDARIAELGRPDGPHKYDRDTHREVAGCGACATFHTLRWVRSRLAAAPLPPAAPLDARMLEWISLHGWTVDPDWACAECRPDSDMLVAGFRCVVHEARARLASTAATPAAGEPGE